MFRKRLKNSGPLFGLLALVATVASGIVSGGPLGDIGTLRRTPGSEVDLLVERGLRDNQELNAMRRESEAAESMLRQARLLPNPSATVKRMKDREGMEQSTMIEASLPLEVSGRRGARIRAAEAELKLKMAAVEVKELSLAFEIRTAYGRAYAAARRVELLRKRVALAADAFALSVAAVEEGRLAPLDRNIEGVELNRMRAKLEAAASEAERYRNELAVLVGGDLGSDVRIADLPDPSVPSGDERSRISEGLAVRADLKGARALELLAESRLTLARADGRPETEVMASYEQGKTHFNGLGIDRAGRPVSLDREMRLFSFGIRVTLPVFDRNQGAVAAAAAEAEAARQRRLYGESVARGEILTAHQRERRADRAFEVMKTAVRDQARRNLEVVRESHLLGERSLGEYLVEQQKLVDIEMETIDAEVERYNAKLELLRAIGSKEIFQ